MYYREDQASTVVVCATHRGPDGVMAPCVSTSALCHTGHAHSVSITRKPCALCPVQEAQRQVTFCLPALSHGSAEACIMYADTLEEVPAMVLWE